MEVLSTWEPDLAVDIAARGPNERPRRFLGQNGFIRDSTGRGWALVGDAGYFKDPLTAHGITDAFLDSHRLAQAFARNPSDVGEYQDERDHFAHRLFEITEDIASLNWDLEMLKLLHIELNGCMKAEGESLKVGELAGAVISAA